MNEEERLRLEHATLMQQYGAARQEIDSLLESSRQVVPETDHSFTRTGFQLRNSTACRPVVDGGLFHRGIVTVSG